MMEHQQIIDALAMNEGVFRHLLAPDMPMAVLWRPSPEKWNLLEVVCHLRDEEILDFRSRTEHVLEYPEMPMPNVNPLQWVEDHKYAEQNYLDVLFDFIKERKRSIEWLNDLEGAQWDNVHQHPKIGPMSATLFLTNWLAHDYLHIRQINRMRYQYLKQQSGISLGYAGEYGPGL